PARLTRLLRGELDWIVMKALEKNRSRRYESATALAADVQRYLADEPVQAWPPSGGYGLGECLGGDKGAGGAGGPGGAGPVRRGDRGGVRGPVAPGGARPGRGGEGQAGGGGGPGEAGGRGVRADDPVGPPGMAGQQRRRRPGLAREHAGRPAGLGVAL